MSGAADALARPYAILEAELDALSPGWERSTRLIEAAKRLSEGYVGPDKAAPVASPHHGKGGSKTSGGKSSGKRGGIHEAGPFLGPEKTPELDATGRAAYLAYFAPRALASMAAASQLAGFEISSDAPVYDIGAGTGAASLWASTLGAEDLRLVDHSPSALAGAHSLLRRAQREPKTIERSVDTAKVLEGATVISAFTLGESVLSETLRTKDDVDAGIDLWLDLVAPARTVLFVDAGDRAHARVLQRLRARAIKREMVVSGPCPHADACPALVREKDWCHHRGPRLLTPRLAAFANAVGRDVESVSFSALALHPNPSADDVKKASTARGVLALAPPLVEKGRVRVPACGPEGIRFIQAKKRDRALHRQLSATTPGDRWRRPVSDDVRDQTLHLEGTHADAWDEASVE